MALPSSLTVPWHILPDHSLAVVRGGDGKARVLGVVEGYLAPRTQAWYARGESRIGGGYLFHGPRGTGKRSLSFALAGEVGVGCVCRLALGTDDNGRGSG